MSSNQRQLTWWGAVLVAMTLMGASANAFTLIGPSTSPGFGVGTAQTFGNGFKWEEDAENLGQTYTITVAFHSSFTSYFGVAGVNAVKAAIDTWDGEFSGQGTGAITAGADGLYTAPSGSTWDLQSIALHELGHAIGLHHPEFGASFGTSRNYDTVGGARVPAGTELMSSAGFGPNQKHTSPASDDLDGFNHLYTYDLVLDYTGSETAVVGPSNGAKIDFFAYDFRHVSYLMPFATTALAITDNAYNPASSPATAGGLITGSDIFFNIPEPASLAIVAAGGLLLAGRRRKA